MKEKIGFILGLLVLLIPFGLSAESLECRGRIPPEETTGFKIEIDLEKPRLKSTIRYFLPDGSAFTQALGISKRIFRSGQLIYIDDFDSSVRVEVKAEANRIVSARFSHLRSDYHNIPLDCDFYGDIPVQEPCPSVRNSNLIDSVRQSTNIDSVIRAIECGDDVNYADASGCTPLMFSLDASCGLESAPMHGPGAIHFGKTKEIFDLLLQSGAYVNVHDRLGETPLIKAVKSNIQDIYESFIAGEVEIDAKDNSGSTALMYAAQLGNKSILSDLLEAKPDRRMRNRDGLTAFDLAVLTERQDLIELLRIPERSLVIKGGADGSCSPLSLQIGFGETVEIELKAPEKMFRFQAKALKLDLMAESRKPARQVFIANKKGRFNFTCGFHGGVNPSAGTIEVK